MCGRFVTVITPEMLAAVFGVLDAAVAAPRYNIAPTQHATVVRSSGDLNRADNIRWGLLPSWSKELGTGLINARCETVAEKPSFRSAIKHRRCIVPMSGFYEWKAEAGKKQPYYIYLADNQPMGIAGLWETWKTPEGESLETFCVLTTSANRLMETIHDRMPVILHPSEYQHWLDKELADPAQLKNLYQPYPADLMTARKVPDLVNNPRFDSPACIVQV